MRSLFLIVSLIVFLSVQAQPRMDSVGTIYTDGNLPVHDPVMIQEKGTYYLFCTGWGISVFSSKDLKTWKKEKPVFSTPPEWALKTINGYRGHTWAPDIQFHNGKYFLYYSVSAFGKNTSCIGVASAKTLDPTSADFGWTDHGNLIQSVPGRDLWNAIDPNLILDDQGKPWLNFGSFWSGIKMVKLDKDLIRTAEPQEWYTIASRNRKPEIPDSAAGNASIEAPFIFAKNNFYYLFISWDACCQGEKSTYKVAVGRSRSIKGPYLDKEGKDLRLGGGSILMTGDPEKWYAVGHSAVSVGIDGKEYFLCHGYDRKDKGKSKLILKPMDWDSEGWPVLKN